MSVLMAPPAPIGTLTGNPVRIPTGTPTEPRPEPLSKPLSEPLLEPPPEALSEPLLDPLPEPLHPLQMPTKVAPNEAHGSGTSSTQGTHMKKPMYVTN